MSDAAMVAFWTMVGAVLVALLPVLTVQIFQYLTLLKKAEAAKLEAQQTRADLTAQVHEVKTAALTTKEELSAKVDAVQHVAVRSKHEITQAFQAGERQGYVGGIEVGKAQATGPGGVTDFNPLS